MADLNITDSDTNNNSQKVQTIRVGLPIPRGTMPTISLEQSQLLAISYFIRVQVFAQEGVYTTSDGKRSQFMMVDLPFIVGTLSTPSNSSNSPATTPMSSPKSTSSNAILYSNTPTSPPPTLYQHPARTSPRISSPPISSLPISSPPISSTPISSPPISSPPLVSTSSPQSTLSSNTGNERKSLIGGMFRKSSTGSQTSDKKRSGKKKSVFSSLRLYKSRKKNDQQEDDTLSVKQEDDALSVEQESSEVVLPPVDDNSTAVTVGGVFDIFARDDIDDFEEDPELQVEKQPVPAFSEMKKEESRVFKMFPDDDDDESDYEPEVVQESISKRINRKEAVFKMFPEEADEDDDDSNEVIKDEQQQLLDEITDTIESFVIDRQPKKQSNVFQMFNDDSSEEEEEEEEVSQKQVKPNHDNQKYQKPNEFIIEYKPDTKDVLMNSTDDSDSEDDINDLLSVLAKREKLLSNQHMK